MAMAYYTLALLIALVTPSAWAADDPLWQALREPNTVVLLRHAHADGGNAMMRDTTGRCHNERRLTKTGRAQARAIGKAFKLHKLAPRAFASPFCRTRETAQLAFGKFGVIDLLAEIASADAAGRDRFESGLRELVARERGAKPLVLVTHQPNIELVTFESIELAEAVVARSEADGELAILGRLRFD